jgi:hypothetical protein
MIRRLLLAAAVVLPTTGCAAGIHTGFEEVHPAAQPVYAERIAVLPVTAEPGSESVRGVIGDSLLRVAERTHPGIRFISSAESLERLNDAGLAERFANLLVGYQQTGIYDRAVLQEVGDALGADHVLQLRVGYEVRNEVGARLFSPGELYEADRKNLHVTAMLWDLRRGMLVWEAAGTSTTRDAEYELPRSLADVVAATAAALAQQMPLAEPETAEAEAEVVGG